MKRPASLSLDLDNQWSYMKTHGDSGWESYPSYLDLAVPRILETLAKLDLKITFFIVGRDASLDKNRDALRLIAAAGHSIANHSFSHEPWFHAYDRQEVEREVIQAEEAIEAATGIRPRGWRGPGFSFSRTLLEVLAQRGYRYDASVFPTFLGPAARLFYFFHSSLSREDRDRRHDLYGSVRDGFRPLKPFEWQLESGRRLLEIPVTTMPLFRLPFHQTYLLYLAKFSEPAARLYLRSALALCQATRTSPSFLLHPTDFLGREDVPGMSYFPAMDQPGELKLRQTVHILGVLKSHFEIVTMEQQADLLSALTTPLKRLDSLGEKLAA